MSLDHVVAGSWHEANLSLRHLLRNLHLHRRLQPLLQQAMIEQFLLDQARNAQISISTEELQQAANGFRRRVGLNSAAATNAWLQRQHWSSTDMEDALERDLLIDKLKDHLFKPQVNQFFAVNRSHYDRVVLRLIVVGREDLAQELLSQIRDEERDFSTLAGEHSTHISRYQGGQLGWLRRQQLTDTVAQAVFAAKPGDIVGPLANNDGYHLWFVETYQPAELDAPTIDLIRQQLFDAWLATKLRDVPMTLPLLSALE